MKISTSIYLTVVSLLTTNFLIKCEEDHDNDIDHELQSAELFSDHLDHFDNLNDVQLNNHGSLKQYQINALKPSNLGDSNLNNNFNKIIQHVEVIHHDGDLVTKYETTSHTNHEKTDDLFNDSLISSLRSSTTPGAYTKIVKKTVIKQNQNGGKYSQEFSQPVEIMYNNIESKEIGIDNSMSKTRTMSPIDHVENIGMSTSSQQLTDSHDNLKYSIQSKVAETSTNGRKSNGSIKRKYSVNSSPSINTMSATSSSKSNYYGGITGSQQIYPDVKDDKTEIISKTEIIGKNGSNGIPLKITSRKPGISSRDKKIIIKYQGNSSDRSDSNEYGIDYNIERTRSSTIGINKKNSSYGARRKKTSLKPGNSLQGEKTIVKKYQDIDNAYNDLDKYDVGLNTGKIRSSNNMLTTTSSSNSNHYDGAVGSLQSYPPMAENDEINTISATGIIGSNSKSVQKISRKSGNSYKGTKTIKTKYQGYDNEYSDLDEYDIDHNTERVRSLTTGISKKNSSNGTSRQKTLIPENSLQSEKTILTKYQDIDHDYNDLDEYDTSLNIEKIRSSNDILSKTSASNSNHYDGEVGSIKNYPIGEDSEINSMSTTEIFDSNGIPIQRISRKPESWYTLVYQDDDKDLSSLDDHSINFDIENSRSSNNIVYRLSPNGYNKLRTTSFNQDNVNNDLLESNTISKLNNDFTYTSPQLNQKASNNFGLSQQTQTQKLEHGSISDESNDKNSNNHVIEYSMADGMASLNSDANSNYAISSFENNNSNHNMSYYMVPSDANISEKYKSSIKTNSNSKNSNSLRMKKKKDGRKKKSRNGSSKKRRSKNKSNTTRNGNGKMRDSVRIVTKNSESSGRQSGSQSNRSSFEINSPESSSFSQSYSNDSPIRHTEHRSCDCNKVRKLSKRQSNESNENNNSKHLNDLENLSVNSYTDIDDLPIYNDGDQIIIGFSPSSGDPQTNLYALSLLPPLPLLQQTPLPPSTPFGQKLTYNQLDQLTDFNEVFNPQLTDKLVNTPLYQIIDDKQHYELPRLSESSGLQMIPFNSFEPFINENLPPPPYPYSTFQHFSSSVPVVLNPEETTFPLSPRLIDILSGQEKQVKVDPELIQTQENNNDSLSSIEGISKLNPESLPMSAQSNVKNNTNNTNNDTVMESTKTIKTTEKLGESGILEVHVVETHDDFFKGNSLSESK